MTKIKVLDLAREVGMEDEKLLLKLKRMGVKMKDKKSEEPESMKPSSDERVIERDSEKEIIEKRVKPTIIRRRTRTLETKVEVQPSSVLEKPEVLSETVEPIETKVAEKEAVLTKPVEKIETSQVVYKEGGQKAEIKKCAESKNVKYSLKSVTWHILKCSDCRARIHFMADCKKRGHEKIEFKFIFHITSNIFCFYLYSSRNSSNK